MKTNPGSIGSSGKSAGKNIGKGVEKSAKTASFGKESVTGKIKSHKFESQSTALGLKAKLGASEGYE